MFTVVAVTCSPVVLLNVQTGSRAHPSSCSGSIGILSPEVKQLEHAVNHSPPFSARIKNEWSLFSLPPVCLHGMGREKPYLFTVLCVLIFTFML